MAFAIATYETSRGRRPVKEFINDPKVCSSADAARIMDALKLLREFGHKRISDTKDIKPIKSFHGLFELRVNDYRLFFSYCRDDAFMFYHIYKKTDSSNKKQDKEIKIAENRMIEYQDSGICG